MNCYIYYILQIEPFQQELGLWAVCDKLQFVRCRGFTHDLLSCHYLPVKDMNTLNTMALVRLHPGLCISVETARVHVTQQSRYNISDSDNLFILIGISYQKGREEVDI